MQLIEGQSSLSKFYTPSWIGKALINCLGSRDPRSILDLGCGEGALAGAARLRWKNATIITVDIDSHASPRVRGLLDGNPKLHRHVVADALDPLLGTRANLRAKSVDLAVCNPPFQRPVWRSGFGQILEAAGLSHVLKASSDVTSDLLFIAQNMRYLSKEGCMGLIVPDAIITGEKMKGARKALAHQIERVIQLPRTAFTNTEAQTFILIIGCGQRYNSITLQELTSDGTYSSPLAITPDEAHSRLDYRFHISKRSTNKRSRTTLGDLNVNITRGKLSSVEARAVRFNVFHTSNFKLNTNNEISFPQRKINKRSLKDQTIARKGDILLARVDRRLEKKIAIVTYGEAALSDCVYRLRCSLKTRKRVLAGLTSPEGQLQINALARGNAARHISITSLLTLSV